MPAGVNEEIWNQAKAQVHKQYGLKEGPRFWKLVNSIYRRMFHGTGSKEPPSTMKARPAKVRRTCTDCGDPHVVVVSPDHKQALCSDCHTGRMLGEVQQIGRKEGQQVADRILDRASMVTVKSRLVWKSKPVQVSSTAPIIAEAKAGRPSLLRRALERAGLAKASKAEIYGRRKRDLLRNQERPQVFGHELDRETLTPVHRSIDVRSPGDHDPLPSGMFRMVPSGDIVDEAERARRMSKRFGKAQLSSFLDRYNIGAQKARDAGYRVGDRVKAKKSYGGRLGRAVGFDNDGSFVIVHHGRGQMATYHNSDVTKT